MIHSVRQVNTRVETLWDELEKSPTDRKTLKTTDFSITQRLPVRLKREGEDLSWLCLQARPAP